MAHPSDLASEVGEALDTTPEARSTSNPGSRESADVEKARRVEALSLRLAGISYEQIADRLGNISPQGVQDMIKRSLERVESRNVQEMRDIENARLDRAQAAIWDKVIKGELGAIDRFVRISQHRARINGLNAPTKVELAVGIRNEMEQAFNQLDNLAREVIVLESKKAIGQGIEEDEEPWRPSS